MTVNNIVYNAQLHEQKEHLLSKLTSQQRQQGINPETIEELIIDKPYYIVEDGRPIPTNDENWTVEDYENYLEQKKVSIL